MSVDTISNMLSAIKNASMVGKQSIELPHSKACEQVAKVIKKSGYLDEVKTFKHKKSKLKGLNITLSYKDGKSAITDIKRVSKPGRRMYESYKSIPTIKPEYGLFVVSTSRGVMSGEDARTKRLGGEVICKVI